MVRSDLVGVVELLDGEEGFLLGNPCIIVSKLVEVYEGFGYREDKWRVVASSRVIGFSRGVGAGVSDLRYLSHESFVITVVCAQCSCGDWRGIRCVFGNTH